MTDSILWEAFRLLTPLKGFGPYSASSNGERHTPGLTHPGYAASSEFLLS